MSPDCFDCANGVFCPEHRSGEPYVQTDAECMQIAGMVAVCEALSERETIRQHAEERGIVAPGY